MRSEIFSPAPSRLPTISPAAFIRTACLPLPDERLARPGVGLRDPVGGFLQRFRELNNVIAREHTRPDPAQVRKLVAAGQSSPAMRRFAMRGLHALDRVGLLEVADRECLGELVWRFTESGEARLPADLRLDPWEFLFMPERHEGQAAAAFRQEFLRGLDGRDIGEGLWNVGIALDQMQLRGRTRKVLRNPLHGDGLVLRRIAPWDRLHSGGFVHPA